jgi:hypothetical protein
MKINKFLIALCVSLCGYATVVQAASYDVKEDVKQTALVADRASVSADKVMDGIADVTLTLKNTETNTVQRVVLQCDTTQATITAFYYMNDVLGGKAQGATGFLVNVYDGPDGGYKHGGDVKVFDSTKDKDNLRKSFERLKKLNGAGFISFEFFETTGGINQNPIAHSMLLPSGYLSKILNAMDEYPDAKGCQINGGATSVYPLKNLTDTI